MKKILFTLIVVSVGVVSLAASATPAKVHPQVGGCATNTTYGPRGMCQCTTCCYGNSCKYQLLWIGVLTYRRLLMYVSKRGHSSLNMRKDWTLWRIYNRLRNTW